jgi:hypothetical protein
MPAKYFAVRTTAGYAPFVVANGIEARLIEAEAVLHANPTSPQWLAILNALRTNGTNSTTPPDTIHDTLGVTGCENVCGYDPGNGLGGSTPEFGEPYPGGFIPPAGYMFAGADTTYPAPPGIGGPNGYCYSNSWYVPCYQGDSMVVQLYVRPGQVQWNAGTGGVGGLAPLVDSGAAMANAADAGAARVAEVFHERAYWLFMTGHRQGDLRRLIRQYGTQYPQFRSDQDVYPAGIYTAPGTGQYGTDVNVPIPTAEYANPHYHGCLDRNA